MATFRPVEKRIRPSGISLGPKPRIAFSGSDDEISYLVLIRFENDGETYPGPFGSAYLDSIKSLLRMIKARQNPARSKGSKKNKKLSATSETVAELLDLLPVSAKARISKEILVEAKASLSRHKGKGGLKTISSVVYKLESFIKHGSP